MIPRHARFGLILAILVAVSDQTSKWWIVDVVMQPPKFIPVTDFFNLVLAYNRGVSFGMLNMQSEIGPWILAAVSLAITFGLLVWMWRANKKLTVVALSLIIGGAVGNVIDRLIYGAVVDFISLHAKGFSWYIFNIADIFIVLGVILFILSQIFKSSSGLENQK